MKVTKIEVIIIAAIVVLTITIAAVMFAVINGISENAPEIKEEIKGAINETGKAWRDEK